jgi:membrane protease YdiL (CAAX protease family)
MQRLQATKPIWHAVVWIMVYIVLVNLGDNLSASLGRANIATSALVLVLAAGLLLYVNRHQWATTYGLTWPRRADLPKVWFYLPLVIIAVLQYAKGLNRALSLQDAAVVIVLMIGVGFVEELLFRGFLYQGILQSSGLVRAIVISGLTFGIGHIVNLLRGYPLADQGLQIIVAIALGITLAILVAVTDSILPGVLFHIFLNISGSLTNDNLQLEILIVIAMLVISGGYALYLWKWLPRHSEVRVGV